MKKFQIIFGYEEYIEQLEGTQYFIKHNMLKTSRGNNDTNVANFLPIITKRINSNNGKEIDTKYKIKALLLNNGKELPEIEVSKIEIENMNFILNGRWNITPIISAGQNNKDKMREVSQIISKKKIVYEEIYSHTGFITINGKLNYLYHGGVIGENKDISVDLSGDKLERYCFTDKEYKLEDAIISSYSIIDLADRKVTIPLLATTYLSPLISILNNEGIYSDYILWLEGKTGTRKSTLAALVLSHFGNFDRNTFPSSFRDTLNSIEKKAFIAKDALTVIDDYCPETKNNKKQDTAEKLFAMYGDRAGRDRMNKDGSTLKSPYVARGLCIVTGECFPELPESRIARALIVDIKANSIYLKQLTELQKNKEKLSYCMMNYIQWVIKNIKKIKEEAQKIYQELREKEAQTTLHGRTNEAINSMNIGFRMFLEFLKDNNILNEDQQKELEKICYETLLNIANSQKDDIKDGSPVNMFLSALEQLYISQKIYLLDYNNTRNTRYDGSFVGYVDNKKGVYYFLPDLLHKEIVKFYKEQDISFRFSKKDLYKYLEDEEYLYRTKGNDRRTVRRKVPLTKNENTFVAVLKEKLINLYLEPKKEDTINFSSDDEIDVDDVF